MAYFDQILLTYTFIWSLVCDQALPSISPVGIGQLEKMLFNNIVYLDKCILIYCNINTGMLNGYEACRASVYSVFII